MRICIVAFTTCAFGHTSISFLGLCNERFFFSLLACACWRAPIGDECERLFGMRPRVATCFCLETTLRPDFAWNGAQATPQASDQHSDNRAPPPAPNYFGKEQVLIHTQMRNERIDPVAFTLPGLAWLISRPGRQQPRSQRIEAAHHSVQSGQPTSVGESNEAPVSSSSRAHTQPLKRK